MFYKVLTENENSIEAMLPMEIVKDHVRVYDNADEDLLITYRAAAFDFASAYMNRILGEATLVATTYRYTPMMFLPMGKPTEILSVTATDKEGNVVELDYHFNNVAGMVLLNGKAKGYTYYTVTYKVNEKPSDVVLMGILKLISHFYEVREEVAIGVSATQIPTNHRACFDLYRLPPTE